LPPASRTEHRIVTNTALPYISNASLTSTDPHFLQGSNNILTSLRNWSENRPGFSTTLETAVSSFKNLQRAFQWRRWVGSSPNGGAFIWMFCDVTGGVAKVYKLQLGTDTQAQLLFTSTSAEPFDFVVSNNTLFFGNGTDMRKWDSQTLKTWGIVAPPAMGAPTLVVGVLSAYTSFCYCSTYWDANDSHESSPSGISTCSGIFQNKNVQLPLVASTNPRVTGIRVYRTPDGGAQDPALMQEITGSPFPNVTGNVTDSTLDVNLSIRVAPEFFRNDPPPPTKGFITYGGRIWGFLNNTTFYSGFEEIANGVPEECWPSGLTGNFYPWSDEVGGQAPLIDGIAVLLPQKIEKVEGDSLDTFRRYTLLQKRGTRSRTSVAALGGSVVWLDTSNTIWLSDLGEIGIPIRPDTQKINPLTCWITIHISGTYHWVVVLDGSNGILYVYDLDLQHWLPPWTVGTTASALASGETSLGVVDLVLARNQTKVLKLTAGTYGDDGNDYSSTAQTNLFPVTPDGNPSWQGTHDWTEIKTDSVPPSQVLQLVDDDPTQGTYEDLTPGQEPSPLLAHQGQFLQSWRYPATPESAAYVSLKMIWAGGKQFHLYNLDMGFHPAGG